LIDHQDGVRGGSQDSLQALAAKRSRVVQARIRAGQDSFTGQRFDEADLFIGKIAGVVIRHPQDAMLFILAHQRDGD
jgi:hypothetical protein